MKSVYVRWFEELNVRDTPIVGGKNSSLGEMISHLKKQNVRVPDGFATTAESYRMFIRENGLHEKIHSEIEKYRRNKQSLKETGKAVRRLILRGEFPEPIADAIRKAYAKLCKLYKKEEVDVAVRSSATAEDLPEASFAGQQETFLNISGEEDLLDACLKCYASLFTDRAIFYREEKHFDHMQVALSIGVQKMVRSDLAGSGVMFSIDTDTGFPNIVVINAAWGLGETVVQGAVDPDEYIVFKPLLDEKKVKPILEKNLGQKAHKMVYARGGSHTTKTVPCSTKEQNAFVLNDNEILELGRWAAIIEKHYGKPMDMEWAKDGETEELFIVQARPETVYSQKKATQFKTYKLQDTGKVLIKGLAIGQAIVSGPVQVLKSVKEIDRFKSGSILVTGMTDPDWVPIMKKAAGIITDHGGRTSHAAIVSRELGLPAVVGTGHATEVLEDDQEVTLSCAEGSEGHIYEGKLKYQETEIDLANLPKTKTRVMLNVGTPAGAFRWWQLPCRGIGLARIEFIVNNIIKIHPMALVDFDRVKDASERRLIKEMTRHYEDKKEYFIDLMACGIAKIAASQYPEPTIVRMSDFKTNEYANLIGGKSFEPEEANPMLGFRGASRYYNDRYRPAFDLECQAIRRAREKIGLTNILVMIPFCRTLEEADEVIKVMRENGLKQGKDGLEIYVMCEIPSNVLLAEGFSDRFDGFSIGSNDLTQLVLGVDRDSAELASLFDEGNEAVKTMIREVIKKAHAHTPKRKVGICGQAPSDKPGFAEFLVQAGIDSISLNPDSVIEVIKHIAEIERK